MSDNEIRVRREIANGNCQLAARRHGVAGIEAKIQQHLMQIHGIACYRPNIGSNVRFNLNRTVECFNGDACDVFDEMLQVNRNLLTFHTPSKCKHLFDYLGAALGAGFHSCQHIQTVLIIDFFAQ